MTAPRRLGRRLGLLALAFLSALLLDAYARWPTLAFLPYVALVPWTILYTDDRSPRRNLVYYFVSAWVGWLLLYPAAYRFGWFAPLCLSIFAVPPWLLFAPLLRRIHRAWRLPRTLSVPLVWVAVEWFRSTFTTTHCNLYALGYSQARFPVLVQVADLAGVYAVSFLVAAVGGLLADGFFTLRDAGWEVRALRGRRFLRSAAAVGLAFIAVIGYGAARIRTTDLRDGPSLALVQPNLRHTIRNAIGVHLAQVLQTEKEVPAGAADLIVWPENAILDDLQREGAYLEDLAWLGTQKGAWFLVGALGRPKGLPGHTTNSAFLVDPDGRIRGRYDKQILFLYTEFVPFDSLLEPIPFLQRWNRRLTRIGWGFLPTGVPGDKTTLLRLPWNGGELPFGVLICVENAYPPVPATAGRAGARFFVNITSEGEAAGTVQEQLLRICMLRAVENGIAYVRLGNTGISGFIDPLGRLRSVLRGHRGGTVSDAGVLVERVALSEEGITVYARSRDAFVKGCVVLVLVLYVLAWRRRGRGTLPGADASC